MRKGLIRTPAERRNPASRPASAGRARNERSRFRDRCLISALLADNCQKFGRNTAKILISVAWGQRKRLALNTISLFFRGFLSNSAMHTRILLGSEREECAVLG
jgi:hypothetical protein